MILHGCVVQQNRACVSDIKRNQCPLAYGACITGTVLRNYTVPPLHHPAQKLVVRDSRHLPARPACRFELHHVMVE